MKGILKVYSEELVLLKEKYPRLVDTPDQERVAVAVVSAFLPEFQREAIGIIKQFDSKEEMIQHIYRMEVHV